jgi:hypothetical protein
VVLAVSGVTLLPVLVPAAPYKTMIARFAVGAGRVLRILKIEEAKVVAEEHAMRDCVVTTTNDRRVLGSINDFAWMTDGYVADAESLHEVALKLAESPCSPWDEERTGGHPVALLDVDVAAGQELMGRPGILMRAVFAWPLGLERTDGRRA